MLFFICDVRPLQLLINNPVFIIIFAVFLPNFGYNIPIKLIISSFKRIHWKLKLGVVWLRNFEGSNFTFDFQRSTLVKNSSAVWKPCYNFLSNFYWNILSCNVFETFDIKFFYWHFLSRTVFKIFDFKVFRVWPWPFTSEDHLGSKKFMLFESPYMTSYLTSMGTISLSRTVFEIFDFKVLRVWPWPWTSEGHLGWKKIMPFKSPYITSYLTYMDTISLSRTVFEIFDFKVFGVWPRPLTSKVHLVSKNVILFETPYMTPYLTSMDTIFLTRTSRTVFEIFDFKDFGVWPSPLTPEGHLGSKIVIPFKFPYMTSYLTSIDTSSLSRAVFEIFDFTFFRVWP